jgi:hypothetical protein
MLSAVELSAGVGAIEAARGIAGEVWSRCRALSRLRLRGLNSEKAVRRRLQETAGPIADDAEWMEAPAEELVERSEQALSMACPGAWPSADRLLHGVAGAAQVALDLVVIQSLAARMGHWRPTRHERRDAAIAYRHVAARSPGFEEYRDLLSRARRSAKTGDHEAAVRHRFAADRLVRTAANLVDAASSLCRLGDRRAALWSLRVALLEPNASFGEPHARMFAEKLYESLVQEELDSSEEILLASQDIEVAIDLRAEGAQRAKAHGRSEAQASWQDRRFEAVLLTMEEGAVDVTEPVAAAENREDEDDVMAALRAPPTGRVQFVVPEAPAAGDEEAMNDAFDPNARVRRARDPDLVDTIDSTWLVRPRKL